MTLIGKKAVVVGGGVIGRRKNKPSTKLDGSSRGGSVTTNADLLLNDDLTGANAPPPII